jgi:VWFA-related protein
MSEQRHTVVILFALFATAFLVSRANSQETQQPSGQQPDPSVNVEQVSIDFVVHDKKDRPVLDLKPGEIEVADDGSPVTLNGLRLVTGKEESERLITLIFDLPGSAVRSKRGMDPSAKTARDIAAKILKMVPEKNFSFSVLNIDGRLHLQQGFTSDRKATARAIEAATEPAMTPSESTVSQTEQQLMKVALTGATQSGTPASAHERTLARTLLSALNTSGRIEQDQHVHPSQACLLALAQSQQQIAQRKALIYFTVSKDWKLDLHARDTIRSIIGAANRAGVSIYIVDLNSIDQVGGELEALERQMMLSSLAPSQDLTPQSNAMRLSVTPYRIEKSQDSGHQALQQLAEGTGGSYIGDEDNLKKPLAEMITDMMVYYEASYAPKIDEYDGKFRAIAVKPLRAGLKIRSQSGYLALPAGSVTGSFPQPFELPLLKILSQAQLPTDLSLSAAILRMGNLPMGNASTLAVEVPLSVLGIREDSSTNLYSVHLSIAADIKDKSGAVVEHFSEDIPRRGPLHEVEAAKLSVITFQRHFIAPPGQYILQAAILDQNSGKSSAKRMAFEIPTPSGAPSLSDIVLVRKLEPSLTKEDPMEPLRSGDNKVTPNLSGQIPPGAKDVSMFMIVHSDPKAPVPAVLNVQLFREGERIGGTTMTSQQTGDLEYTARVVTFSISQPMNGQFEVKAILNQGGRTAESSASFTMADVQSSGGEQLSADASSSLPRIPSLPAGSLSITFPTNSVARPAPAELESILVDATKFAIDYSDSLPNFMCEQVTSRSTDKSGNGVWKRKDKITELLTFVEHEERRTKLTEEQDGLKSQRDNGASSRGMSSSGEFGTMLKSIFEPSSKAEFQWKETGVLGDETVQVFDYRVSRQNSTFALQEKNTAQMVVVGFHGQVYIDSATRGVRRVTQVADDVPEKFPIRASSVSVDYDYVSINDHDYLIPVSAQIMTSRGRRNLSLNEIEFRNFRRFGSNARVLTPSAEAKP